MTNLVVKLHKVFEEFYMANPLFAMEIKLDTQTWDRLSQMLTEDMAVFSPTSEKGMWNLCFSFKNKRIPITVLEKDRRHE